MISESFFIRYVLKGEDFGGWVQPRSGVSSYFISTTFSGRPATGIKAILYAPGCAIRSFDIPLSGSNHAQYSFICQPIKSISIRGAVLRLDRLWRRRRCDFKSEFMIAREIAGSGPR
jgi:hypothetical protein